MCTICQRSHAAAAKAGAYDYGTPGERLLLKPSSDSTGTGTASAREFLARSAHHQEDEASSAAHPTFANSIEAVQVAPSTPLK